MITTLCATSTNAASGVNSPMASSSPPPNSATGGHGGERAGGPVAHVRHRARPALEARAVPDAEQLLRAVNGEDQSDADAQDQ